MTVHAQCQRGARAVAGARTNCVYFAHVLSPSESARFSDNYIDLQPEARELKCAIVEAAQPSGALCL
jgi:hypothetical protein